MIPMGTWRARATEGALGFTQNGSEQVAVALVMEPDQRDDVDGLTITWYGYFTEKTEDSTLKALRTLGWSTDDISDLSGITDNIVEVVIVHEEDQDGTERARVRWINAPGGRGGVAMKDRMDESAARSFAERMRGKAMASRATTPPRAAAPAAAPATRAPAAAAPSRQRATAKRQDPARTAPTTAPADDDIPF